MPNKLIAVLRIIGAFGIGGGLRASLLSDSLASYREVYDKGGRKFSLRIQRFVEKSRAIIFLDGITDRTAAESLKSEYFYVRRCDLPPTANGEFYLCDLVGKEVAVAGSALKCKILSAQNFGAGDLLEVSCGEGSFFVPFTKENFPDTDGEMLMTLEAFEGFRN
ncbi:MAG: ribosome maturation factor RimM [Holosporaceae bacterium]|nr:ribosome maturation factor RimM [Holosporaceae bacterium]